MPDLGFVGWVMVGLCAVMVGIAKTGIPGFGILVVPLMAAVLPARSSTGALLGMLILADVFAVIYYRRAALWSHLWRLIPIAFAGIVAGYFWLKVTSDEQLRPIIGVIVLLMLAVNWRRTGTSEKDMTAVARWWFAVVFGLLAGITTMMANAAGPVMIAYLLAMRLPKQEFVGTAAWFFFVINWLKVPFSIHLGLITLDSVKLGLAMIPLIAAGALLGIVFLKRLPQKAFEIIVQLLAAAAAVKLLF